jgi:hypothetical protein
LSGRSIGKIEWHWKLRRRGGIHHFMGAACRSSAAMAGNPEPAPAQGRGAPELLVREVRLAHPDDQAVSGVLEWHFWSTVKAGRAVPL